MMCVCVCFCVCVPFVCISHWRYTSYIIVVYRFTLGSLLGTNKSYTHLQLNSTHTHTSYIKPQSKYIRFAKLNNRPCVCVCVCFERARIAHPISYAARDCRPTCAENVHARINIYKYYILYPGDNIIAYFNSYFLKYKICSQLFKCWTTFLLH